MATQRCCSELAGDFDSAAFQNSELALWSDFSERPLATLAILHFFAKRAVVATADHIERSFQSPVQLLLTRA